MNKEKETKRINPYRCAECEMTKKEHKEKYDYAFNIVKCRLCKQYFCEGCLVADYGCPYCSDIVYI